MSLNVNLLAISRRDIIFEKSFCLWYQPYHVLPYTKWGIHVRFSSWIKATSLFYSEEPHLTSRLNNSIVAAFLYIYVHGMFHFIIENIFSLMELHTKNPLYYNDYYTNIYLQTFNTVNCLEETLANAYLYENASECHLDKEYLKNLLTNQENAYADFLAYTDTKFSKGCIKLISLIKDNHTDLFNYKINDIESLFNFKTMTVFNNLVPIWLHYNPTPLN
jgi:hypothetical protein